MFDRAYVLGKLLSRVRVCTCGVRVVYVCVMSIPSSIVEAYVRAVAEKNEDERVVKGALKFQQKILSSATLPTPGTDDALASLSSAVLAFAKQGKDVRGGLLAGWLSRTASSGPPEWENKVVAVWIRVLSILRERGGGGVGETWVGSVALLARMDPHNVEVGGEGDEGDEGDEGGEGGMRGGGGGGGGGGEWWRGWRGWWRVRGGRRRGSRLGR